MDTPKTKRNVHMLSRTRTFRSVTCSHPWLRADQYLYIASPKRKASNIMDVKLLSWDGQNYALCSRCHRGVPIYLYAMIDTGNAA